MAQRISTRPVGAKVLLRMLNGLSPVVKTKVTSLEIRVSILLLVHPYTKSLIRVSFSRKLKVGELFPPSYLAQQKRAKVFNIFSWTSNFGTCWGKQGALHDLIPSRFEEFHCLGWVKSSFQVKNCSWRPRTERSFSFNNCAKKHFFKRKKNFTSNDKNFKLSVSIEKLLQKLPPGDLVLPQGTPSQEGFTKSF